MEPRIVRPARHAAITNALEAGVPLRDAQILARHADPRTPSSKTMPEETSTATASISPRPTSLAYSVGGTPPRLQHTRSCLGASART
jgi:hypothetical protein